MPKGLRIVGPIFGDGKRTQNRGGRARRGWFAQAYSQRYCNKRGTSARRLYSPAFTQTKTSPRRFGKQAFAHRPRDHTYRYTPAASRRRATAPRGGVRAGAGASGAFRLAGLPTRVLARINVSALYPPHFPTSSKLYDARPEQHKCNDVWLPWLASGAAKILPAVV